MANHRSLALGAFAGFIADAAQQAVAHFLHDSGRAARFLLVLAGAEVDACSVDKPCHIASGVGAAAAKAVGQGCYAAQARVVSLGHCIC